MLGLDAGIFIEADVSQQFLGLHGGFSPVDDATLGYLVAKKEVLSDRQFRDEREFLVDDRDASML